MRKFIITSTGIFCFLYAQSQVFPGIKAGVNLATAESTSGWKNEFRPGINFGGLVLFCVSKEFFIQPEILYSLKGYKFSSGGVYTGTATLNYFNIPVLFGLTLSKNTNYKLSIYTGPEIGFLLSGKSKKTDIYRGSSEDDLKDLFKKTDIEIVAGAAFQFNDQIGMEARYCYGFTDLGGITYYDNLGNPIVTQREGGNRVFQLGLFYLLRKKK
jgi:hypothetical protein